MLKWNGELNEMFFKGAKFDSEKLVQNEGVNKIKYFLSEGFVYFS